MKSSRSTYTAAVLRLSRYVYEVTLTVFSAATLVRLTALKVVALAAAAPPEAGRVRFAATGPSAPAAKTGGGGLFQ